MIQRKREIDNLKGLLNRHRVVGIVGARQVGKTTLARSLMEREFGRSRLFVCWTILIRYDEFRRDNGRKANNCFLSGQVMLLSPSLILNKLSQLWMDIR